MDIAELTAFISGWWWKGHVLVRAQGHRQAGLPRVNLPLSPMVRKCPSAQCTWLLHRQSQVCPLQRAIGYQLAKMVQVTVRKRCTAVRYQRWLLQMAVVLLKSI